MLRIFVLAILMVALICSVSQAADLAKMQDKFFSGLAAVIEDNMDNPTQCLRQADSYYEETTALIEQIRDETAKVMTQAAPMMQEMMDKYSSMSEEELEALEKGQQGRYGMRGREAGPSSPGMERYSKALEAFTERYPMQGMEMAMKAMRLMPQSSMNMMQQFKMQGGY